VAPGEVQRRPGAAALEAPLVEAARRGEGVAADRAEAGPERRRFPGGGRVDVVVQEVAKARHELWHSGPATLLLTPIGVDTLATDIFRQTTSIAGGRSAIRSRALRWGSLPIDLQLEFLVRPEWLVIGVSGPEGAVRAEVVSRRFFCYGQLLGLRLESGRVVG
jgi:hypothetical protein